MASAVVGMKRSFATMSDLNTGGTSIAQDAGQEALLSHLREIVSTDDSGRLSPYILLYADIDL